MKTFLKHERDTAGDFQKRVLLHIPIGLLIGIPLLGLPVLFLFVKYEQSEDKWCKDEAWKDYFGAVAGAVFSEVAFFVFWMVR